MLACLFYTLLKLYEVQREVRVIVVLGVGSYKAVLTFLLKTEFKS